MFNLRSSLFVIVVLALPMSGISQRAAEAPDGLSFEKPPNWIEGSLETRTASISRFTFNKEDRARLLANEKSSGVVAVFYRDDPKVTPGIIPTIQVILRPKGAKMSFDQFRKAVLDPKIMAVLEEFTFLGDATTIEVSGVNAVQFNATFKVRRGEKAYAIRSRTYAIPRADYFIQISMSDEDDDGWTEKEFTNFISSVRIVD